MTHSTCQIVSIVPRAIGNASVDGKLYFGETVVWFWLIKDARL